VDVKKTKLVSFLYLPYVLLVFYSVATTGDLNTGGLTLVEARLQIVCLFVIFKPLLPEITAPLSIYRNREVFNFPCMWTEEILNISPLLQGG